MSKNFKIGILFLTFALIWMVFLVPTIGEDWRQSTIRDIEFFTVSPRFFPYLSAGIMGILSLLLLLESLLSGKAKEEDPPNSPSKIQLKPVLVFMGIGIGYIAALPFLGVMVATPLCLAACFWYFKFRRWGWILLLSIGVTVIIYYCFEKLMMVPLPRGLLEM
jgi:putative tricarboxylic transport membrane protein